MPERLVVQQIPLIESYQDMADRPDYHENIDPTGVDPDQVMIIGQYGPWKDEIQCGLSDCHSWHGKGFFALFPDQRGPPTSERTVAQENLVKFGRSVPTRSSEA